VRKPLLQVTLADLQQFADSLGDLAPASRFRTLSAIKSLLAFGHRTGYLAYDVGRALRLPAVRNRLAERILPEAELHRILSLEANLRNRAILTLLYASGMRVSGSGNEVFSRSIKPEWRKRSGHYRPSQSIERSH